MVKTIFWALLLTLSSIMAIANDGESDGLRLKIHLASSNDDYRYRLAKTTHSLEKFLEFDLRRAELTLLSESRVRVHLDRALRFAVFDSAEQTELAERVLKSFVIESTPDQIDLLLQLQKNPILTTDKNAESDMGKIIEKVQTEGVFAAVKGLATRFAPPAVAELKHLVLHLDIESLGSAEGEKRANFLMIVRDVSGLDLSGYGIEERTIVSDDIYSLVDPKDRNLLEYIEMMKEIVSERQKMLERGWINYQDNNYKVQDIEGAINDAENVVSLFSKPLLCRSLFR